jgi:hypothetical protein
MDDWLTDEMRGRAVGFWSRGVLGTWPIEAQGYVFLGNAVLAAGARLFGQEWTGQEPWRCQLPILDRSRSYAADGFDAVYAVNLLGEYMPELGIGPMLDWSLREKPLSHEQWKLAFDIYKDHAAQQNLLATTRMQSVARQLIEAAASGTLATATRSQSGKYVPIDRENGTRKSRSVTSASVR